MNTHITFRRKGNLAQTSSVGGQAYLDVFLLSNCSLGSGHSLLQSCLCAVDCAHTIFLFLSVILLLDFTFNYNSKTRALNHHQRPYCLHMTPHMH